MESEITRINQIIRDLLDFSRTSAGAVKRISIHQLVMETLEMLRPQPMMAHFTMNHMLDATRDIVQADPNQLKQVFLNIFINAADSMAEGSKTPDLSSANILTISSQDRGEFIELRFADTGPGIKQEDLVRIFDPFYTTKETGKGTGLGLSVCYSIVKGLGGEIRAESSMDGGTTIIVILPICREQ
jgi:signal transduction histidine kinase